jgi:hypothetical protein
MWAGIAQPGGASPEQQKRLAALAQTARATAQAAPATAPAPTPAPRPTATAK